MAKTSKTVTFKGPAFVPSADSGNPEIVRLRTRAVQKRKRQPEPESESESESESEPEPEPAPAPPKAQHDSDMSDIESWPDEESSSDLQDNSLEALENSKPVDELNDFYKLASDYNSATELKRIPHLCNATEILIKRLMKGEELTDDDMALLRMMNKSNQKISRRKSKARSSYVKKAAGTDAQPKPPKKAKLTENDILKDEDIKDEETRLRNNRLKAILERRKKRRAGDVELRQRDKFFKGVIDKYIDKYAGGLNIFSMPEISSDSSQTDV